MPSIEDVIYGAVRKVKLSLTETELTPATRFDQYNISSLEMAMIVFEINDYFDIEIEPYTLMTLACIDDAVQLIEGLLTPRVQVQGSHG